MGRFTLTLSAVALLSISMFSQSGKPSGNGLLLVANKGDNGLGIIDPVNRKDKLPKFPKAALPDMRVVVSRDGQTRLCANLRKSGRWQPGPTAAIWWSSTCGAENVSER